MNDVIRIALCQANLPVGDLDGNVERVGQLIADARAGGAELVVLPELALTGYPPEDLLLKTSFVTDAAQALQALAEDVHDIVAIVGLPSQSAEERLRNSAAVLAGGGGVATYHKHFLPNYAVFDEQRYFAPGDHAVVLDLGGVRVGITICEDIWEPGGPAEWATMDGGAGLLVNLSASPYHRAKGRERERLFAERCTDYRCFLAFCNAVGGQDELVFDGHSLVIDPTGAVLARGHQFEEDLLVVDLDLATLPGSRRAGATTGTERVRIVTCDRSGPIRPALDPPAPPALLDPEAEVYRALTLGTADYLDKNGFRGAVLGLSGGIDSALSLAIAVDAIGPEAVTAVSMPSRYTAEANRDDATVLARRLGVTLLETPIDTLVRGYAETLARPFADTEPDIAEENLQARIRGNLLMALSNKFGWLVLTTGNKSEMSVGYTTLYGDMAGGFAILKDVLKTWVYRLSVWRNREREIIPQRILDKPPTAELRANQLDTDSLPPYDTLDAILEAYIEQDLSPTEIEALGFDRATVCSVVQLVDRAEYKRRQAPPGVRISTRAFGKDRRLPITNRYRPR